MSSGLFPESIDSWKDQFLGLALVLRCFMIVQSNHLSIYGPCLGLGHQGLGSHQDGRPGRGGGSLFSKGQEGFHDLWTVLEGQDTIPVSTGATSYSGKECGKGSGCSSILGL